MQTETKNVTNKKHLDIPHMKFTVCLLTVLSAFIIKKLLYLILRAKV